MSSISGARLAGAITIVLLAACGDDGTSTADGDVTNDAGGMRDDGGTDGGGATDANGGGGNPNGDGGVTCNGCLVDGTCIEAGAPNPNNTCEICTPDADVAAWTTKEDGAACDDGSFCNGTDTCSGGTCSVHSGDPCSGTKGFCYEVGAGCGCPPGWTGDDCDRCVVYVRKDGDDTRDGRSWANAVATLPAARAIAEPTGCDVWVAEGTYLPPPSTTTNPRMASFRLWEGAHLYGGFAGNEWALDQRDARRHPPNLLRRSLQQRRLPPLAARRRHPLRRRLEDHDRRGLHRPHHRHRRRSRRHRQAPRLRLR